jgi:hypothetical protein
MSLSRVDVWGLIWLHTVLRNPTSFFFLGWRGGPARGDHSRIYRDSGPSINRRSVVIMIGNGIHESISGGSKSGPRSERRERRTEGGAEAEPNEQESAAQSQSDTDES